MRIRELTEAPGDMDSIFGTQIQNIQDREAQAELDKYNQNFGNPFSPSTPNNDVATGPNNPGTAGNLRFASGALTTLNGTQSRLTRDTAGDQMAATIRRGQRMAQLYGGTLTVNDAIAKSGTSRETNTQGSQHFHGNALDISTAGMTSNDKIRLIQAAQRAGFTGFGFGNTILHVDTGPRRHWSYGNSAFAGVSVASLGRAVRSGQLVGGDTRRA